MCGLHTIVVESVSARISNASIFTSTQWNYYTVRSTDTKNTQASEWCEGCIIHSDITVCVSVLDQAPHDPIPLCCVCPLVVYQHYNPLPTGHCSVLVLPEILTKHIIISSLN